MFLEFTFQSESSKGGNPKSSGRNSSNEFRTWVAPSLCLRVILSSGTKITCIPARLAAVTPLGASSKTKHWKCRICLRHVKFFCRARFSIKIYLLRVRIIGESFGTYEETVRSRFSKFDFGICAAHDDVVHQTEQFTVIVQFILNTLTSTAGGYGHRDVVQS